jgi:RecA/RadA recombinase
MAVKTKKKAAPADAKSETKVKGPTIIIDRNDPEFIALKKELNAQTASEARDVQNRKPVISTGSHALDWGCGKIDPVFGNGGIPLRSFLEVFGSTGAGKSSMFELMMAQMQKRFPDCWIGVLYSEEPVWDRMLAYGVNLDRIMVFNCYEPIKDQEVKWRLAEQRLDDLNDFSRNEQCKMIGVDSVKGLTSAMQIFEKGDPNKAKDRSFYEKETAVRAQMMEKFFNRQKIDNVNSTVTLQ